MQTYVHEVLIINYEGELKKLTKSFEIGDHLNLRLGRQALTLSSSGSPRGPPGYLRDLVAHHGQHPALRLLEVRHGCADLKRSNPASSVMSVSCSGAGTADSLVWRALYPSQSEWSFIPVFFVGSASRWGCSRDGHELLPLFSVLTGGWLGLRPRRRILCSSWVGWPLPENKTLPCIHTLP